MEVRASALRHGCTHADIEHAVRNAVAAFADLDDPFVLYLGPDRTGRLLEVMVAIDAQEIEVVFQAMVMRRKYRRLLR